jgi:hypothetical protein
MKELFWKYQYNFCSLLLFFCSAIALATFIETNQNPNSERRREAPPLTIWVWLNR